MQNIDKEEDKKVLKKPKGTKTAWQRWDSNPRLRRDWCLKPAPQTARPRYRQCKALLNIYVIYFHPIIISTILLLGNISILLHNKHTWNFRLTLYLLYITMLQKENAIFYSNRIVNLLYIWPKTSQSWNTIFFSCNTYPKFYFLENG